MTALVEELGEDRFLIDLGFRDHEGIIAAYLLPTLTGWVAIETGPTTCADRWMAGLQAAGLEPADVSHLFVTHIHLDHAGAVGTLLRRLPNATAHAHAIGVPHLVDPSRLAASALRAWGPGSERLWGATQPVPSERIVPLTGTERFPLRPGFLEVMATPGHAKHHLSFYDTATHSLFAGDSLGVHLPGALRARPAVPPPELDLEALFASVDQMARREPQRILYSHFGPAPGGASPFADYARVVDKWRDVAFRAATERPDVAYLAARLQEWEEAQTRSAGRPVLEDDVPSMISGYTMAAQGFLRYFETRGLIPGGAR